MSKKGEQLLIRNPSLRSVTELNWSKRGAGPDFDALYQLLKENKTMIQNLNLSC